MAFMALFGRDVEDHLHSRRFHIGIIISILLFCLTATVRIRDFHAATQERVLFIQRWLPALREQVDRDEAIEVENTRAVSPLSEISIGLEPITPLRFTSTKEGLRLGPPRGAQNTVDALFGAIDLAFIIGVVLSLMAIALSFDSVCGERSSGTLALVFSYPVRRFTFFAAKVAGTSAVLTLFFLCALAVTIVLNLTSGLGIVSASHWVLFALASVIYLVFFVTVGVSVSAWRRTPTDAAMMALFLWVILVFLVPRVVGLLVSIIYPPIHGVELALREDQAVSRLKSEHVRKLQAAFETYAGSSPDVSGRVDDFIKMRNTANSEFRDERRKIITRLWDEQDRDEALRERYTRLFSMLSPCALYNGVAAELAWTGFLQRQHFREEARNYDDQVGRRLAESREFYGVRTSRTTLAAVITHDDIRAYMVPFQPTWVQSEAVISGVVPSILLLFGFVVLAYLFGFAALYVLDVRA